MMLWSAQMQGSQPSNLVRERLGEHSRVAETHRFASHLLLMVRRARSLLRVWSLSAGAQHRRVELLTHAVGTAARLARMGSADNLELRTSGCRRHIAEHRRLVAEAAGTVQPGFRRAGNRLVVVEGLPSAVASCEAAHTDRVGLALAPSLARCARLPDAGAPLLACAGSLLPSSWPSTLCGFP